ncbi:MAG TPA: hypothetical protein VHN11_21050 [Xanthobacteraceae bacterium]|jgi:hypothetical protein|nr:hypothetical protein [Xanthobacteraceae bacterium]
MPDGLKLTELDTISLPVQSTDLLYLVREGSGAESFKATVDDIAAAIGGDVTSVNGQTGAVVLDAGDVGAAPTGSITTSGLTMNTARILGRTTASAGAIEELTASGVLDLISSTRGVVLYRSASGWSALTPGTDGYVLTTHGAGADPTWAAGGGGTALSANSLTSLTGQTLTLATLDSNKNILLTPHGTGLTKLSTNSTGVAVQIQNTNTGGYSSIDFLASDGSIGANMGYGNSGVGLGISTMLFYSGSAPFALYTAGTLALSISTSQNAIFSGSLKTSAPTGGSAGAWKLGTYDASATVPTGRIRIEVAGAAYYVPGEAI